MSTPSSEYNGAVDAEFEIFWFSGDATVSSTALFANSSLLLIGQEIEYVWKHPSRPSSWLYALARYPGWLNLLIDVGFNSYTTHCNSIARLSNWSQIIALTATYLVQILRTYAVCDKRQPLAGVLVALGLVAIAIRAVNAVKSSCTNSSPLSLHVKEVQSVFDLAFESVILGATAWATWSQVRAAKQLGISRQTLAHSLLRNGLIYYTVFLVLGLSDLVTYN